MGQQCFHVAKLACSLRRVIPRRRRVIVAIDGIDGSGKTPLAIGLAERLPISVLSVDNYLNRHRDSYLKNLRWTRLKNAINANSGIVVLEGVCSSFVLKRLNLHAFRHIYVKKVSECGLWLDKEECEFNVPIETFLDERREEMRLVEVIFTAERIGSTANGDISSFREEVIRYHAKYLPSKQADYIFLRRPNMRNNALQRTNRILRTPNCRR